MKAVARMALDLKDPRKAWDQHLTIPTSNTRLGLISPHLQV